MSLQNDIMRFSVLGFRSEIRIELQAPVIVHVFRKDFLKTMISKKKSDDSTFVMQNGTFEGNISTWSHRSQSSLIICHLGYTEIDYKLNTLWHTVNTGLAPVPGESLV